MLLHVTINSWCCTDDDTTYVGSIKMQYVLFRPFIDIFLSFYETRTCASSDSYCIGGAYK